MILNFIYGLKVNTFEPMFMTGNFKQQIARTRQTPLCETLYSFVNLVLLHFTPLNTTPHVR